MKRQTKLTVLLILLLTVTTVTAQDFRVYMSKTIMDLKTSSKMPSAEDLTDWIEVEDKGLYSNALEVDQMVRTMQATGMKGLAEAEQFRKMRDHTILTFKIDDGGKNGTYNIEAQQGVVKKKMSTSKYFFLNVPMSDNDVNLTIASADNPENSMSIKCLSKPFGNDSLYLFQLDKPCQTYDGDFTMEVLMSDSTWVNLPLRNQKFQCLFASSERYPSQAYLGVDGKKLELDISKWNTGAGLAATFNILNLKKTCSFTKHDAEFATFNWIGSGLFAKYDTLFLQVRDEKANIISDARVSVQRIDKDKRPVTDSEVRYLGYKSKTHEHMIITRGYPAYIEIQAQNHLPLLYHYLGATDPETGILSKTAISDYVVMTPGELRENEPTFYKKELRFLQKKDFYLNSKKKIWDASILSIDMVKTPVTNTVYYSPNGATDELKMVDGELLEKYAVLNLHYAVPKNTSVSDAGTLWLDIQNTPDKVSAPFLGNEVISAAEYPGLEHSFVISRYDLSNCVPQGETAALTLQNGSMTDRQYPLICNFSFTDEEIEEKAEDETTPPSEEMEDEDPKGAMDKGLDMNIPVNFDFKISDKCVMKLACKLDYIKGEINWKLTITMMQSEDEKDGMMDKARKRNVTVNDYKKFKSEDSEGKERRGKIGFSSDLVDSDKSVNEIFSQTALSGTGFKASFFASGKVPLTGWSKHAKTNFFDFVEELGGTFGYGITYNWTSLSNMFRAKDMDAAATWADLIETFIRFGFKFDFYMGGGMGITTYNDQYADQAAGRAYYAEFLTYAILAAWLEAGLPANPMLNFSVGIRGGAKAGASMKASVCFDGDHGGFGMKFTARALMQYYLNIDTFLGGYHKSGDIFNLGEGDGWLMPDDDTNPYHANFPNWLKKSTRAKSYAPMKVPEEINYGNLAWKNIASDASPRFLSEYQAVINNLHDSQVYDDDGIDVISLLNNESDTISSKEHAAVRYNLDKHGDRGIIVYQQCDTDIDPETITDDNLDQRTMEVSRHFNVCASIQKSSREWQAYNVYSSEEANLRPAAAIQDDGKAAAIWLSGTFDDSVARTDSIMKQNMEGHLMYSRFDGTSWGEPVRLMQVDATHAVGDYQLIMRNDTVLVALQEIANPTSEHPVTTTSYMSIPADHSRRTMVSEPLNSLTMSFKRVGNYNVIGLTHEVDSNKYDVYVRTLDMKGYCTGIANTDVGLQNHSPIGCRIIPSVNATAPNDFALMWMENTDHGITEEGKRSNLNGYHRILNVARMSYLDDIQAATPITIGAEQDDLMMLDFDGFLDEEYVKAIYTLSDPETAGGTILVENEKLFNNSFDYELDYDQRASTSGMYIPFVLTINNTGTSAIKSITAHLNDQTIEVDNAFVPPFQTKSFIISYQMEDDFNGYISSNVEVEYENVLKPRPSQNKQRRAGFTNVSLNKVINVNNVDTELRLLSQHVDDEGNNIFVVEVDNLSKMKFRPTQSVMLAVYDAPRFSTSNLVTEKTLIPVSEFQNEGDHQKLITTLTVPGVMNETAAILMATIVDNENADIEDYQQQDRSNCYQNVTLHATNTPTYINGVRTDLNGDTQIRGQRISITKNKNGITIRGLQWGETVRLYNIDGKEILSATGKYGDLFIPIGSHAFYILSNNDESIKFLF